MSFLEKYQQQYGNTNPNAPIDILLDQPYTIELDDKRVITGDVDIHLRLLPRVKVQMIDNKPDLIGLDCVVKDDFKLHLNDLNADIQVRVTSITDRVKCVFQPLEDDFLIHETDSIKEVCCSLINFRPIDRTMILNWENWKITVQPVNKLKELIKEMHNSGGYLVTHLISISKDESVEFTVNELQSLWSGLYHFFSFANGGWSTPVLPVGYNSSGQILCRQMVPRATSLWCDSTRNWFEDNQNVLSKLFQGFMSLIIDSVWGKELQTAIYWYVNSERSLPSLDTAIILSQSALELLAWQYLVIDKQILTSKKFKQNPTSENIRRLLSEENINTSIPTQCNSLLHRFSNHDGPFAITELRNDIVHPVPKQPLNNHEMNQVWDLSMYYIERILLNLCQYPEVINHRCRHS